MKAILFVTWATDAAGKETWQEPYDKPEIKDQASADAFGKKLIDWFNSTLSPGERARRLVRVEFNPEQPPAQLEHNWEKTNLITILGRGRVPMHDKYACTHCGITAKRFGVDWPPTRDAKFKAAKFEACTGGEKKK